MYLQVTNSSSLHVVVYKAEIVTVYLIYYILHSKTQYRTTQL